MLVNPQSMPAWICWTHWLSPFYYAYCSLMINEMSGIKIDFEVGPTCTGGTHRHSLVCL